MTDQPPVEPKEVKEVKETETARALGITLIISCAVIVFTCIASVTLVLYTFLSNPPW